MKQKTLQFLCVMVIIFLRIQIFPYLVAYPAHFPRPVNDQWYLFRMVSIALVGVLSIIVLVYFGKISIFQKNKIDKKNTLIFFILSIVYFALCIFLNNVIVTQNSSAIAQDMQSHSGSYFLYLMVIDDCLLSPIVEELLFRGALMSVWKSKGRDLLFSVLFSASLFSILHIYHYDWSLVDFLYYFIPSSIIAILFAKTQSIYYPILLHMAWNTYAFWGLIQWLISNPLYYSHLN